MRLLNPIKKPVKVYWWRYELSAHGNFGDEITRLIIGALSKRKVEWAKPDECDLVGAGSILQDVAPNIGANRPFVWGSGFIEEGDANISADIFKILGVRGQYTASRITGSVPKNLFLGDPGLLASHLVNADTAREPHYRLGIVPHYVDLDSTLIRKYSQDKDVLIIDPTDDCLTVVNGIANCHAILSSSLHGLIVADSFKIPNIHLPLSDLVRGGDYKFRDYYSAFQARDYRHMTPEEVASLNVDQLCRTIKDNYQHPDDLEAIQAKIKQSLPY